MKFFNTLLLALTASVVSAAPTATTDDDSVTIPSEAIVGQFSLAPEEYPVFVHQNDTSFVLLLNSTVLDEAYSSNSKRDAEAWGWIKFRPGQPINKREADASPWGWIKFRPGQPINKREADASPWGWIKFRPGQPINKREAEADADADAEAWGWIKFRPGQPINKREAEADAEPWGWIKFRPGQPINKREAEAEAQPWDSLLANFADFSRRDAEADA